MRIESVDASRPPSLDVVRALFREYQGATRTDLCFQGFEAELALLPGAYAPPAGRLLLALLDGDPAGCGAIRPLAPGVAELKRMWVRPAFRDAGWAARWRSSSSGAPTTRATARFASRRSLR